MVAWIAVSVASAKTGEAYTRCLRAESAHHRGAHPVAARQHDPHRRQPSIADLDEHLQPPGRKFRTVTPCSWIWRAQWSGSRRCSSSTTTIAPPAARVAKTSSTDRSHSRVDQRQAPVGRPDVEVAVEELDGVHRRVVGDLDALGFPGRAGGEQHVGQLIGIGDRGSRCVTGCRACRFAALRRR